MEIPSIIKYISIAVLTTHVISGCATITTGTDQGINVVTEKDIIGASCTLMDSKGNRSFIPRPPGTTYMTRGNAPLVITCTMPGYKSTTLEIGEEVAGATLGNTKTGDAVMRESVKSSHTATAGEAFAAVTRIRIAAEGAAEKNIRQGLQKISELSLN